MKNEHAVSDNRPADCTVCNCDCHKPAELGGAKVEHVGPCCEECVICKARIKIDLMPEHFKLTHPEVKLELMADLGPNEKKCPHCGESVVIGKLKEHWEERHPAAPLDPTLVTLDTTHAASRSAVEQMREEYDRVETKINGVPMGTYFVPKIRYGATGQHRASLRGTAPVPNSAFDGISHVDSGQEQPVH